MCVFSFTRLLVSLASAPRCPPSSPSLFFLSLSDVAREWRKTVLQRTPYAQSARVNFILAKFALRRVS